MKALSFTQPWLHTIGHLDKRIENRTGWSGCSHRGPILLHAAKSVGTRACFDETVDQILHILDVDTKPWPARCAFAKPFAECSKGRWVPPPTLHRGGIVGRAHIVGVLDPKREPERVSAFLAHNDAQRRWWFGGFALVLADVEPLPFVPWKGALGLFEVPDDYAARAAA